MPCLSATGCGKKNIFAKQNLNKRTLAAFFHIRTMQPNPTAIFFWSRTASKIVLPFLFVEGRDGRDSSMMRAALETRLIPTRTSLPGSEEMV